MSDSTCIMGRSKSTFIAAATLALFGWPVQSMADPQSSADRSRPVTLSDLDLTTADGVGVAKQRLHQMARRLCSQTADRDDLSRQPNYVACIDDAVSKAMSRVQALAQLQAREKSVDQVTRNQVD
jgi:UrcA family protein